MKEMQITAFLVGGGLRSERKNIPFTTTPLCFFCVPPTNTNNTKQNEKTKFQVTTASKCQVDKVVQYYLLCIIVIGILQELQLFVGFIQLPLQIFDSLLFLLQLFLQSICLFLLSKKAIRNE